MGGMAAQAVSFNLSVKTKSSDPSLGGQNVSVSYNGANKSLVAGEFRATFNGPTAPGYSSSFIAYCTDLLSALRSGYFTPRTFPEGPNPETNPNWVALGGQKAAYLYNNNAAVVSGDNLQTAALQIAIWEVLYDSNVDLMGGLFKVATVDVKNAAQVILNTLAGVDDETLKTYTQTWWQATTGADGSQLRNSQGIIGPGPRTSVPAPVAGLGLTSLLIGLCSVARRRK
jgi:hypothetical protein